MKAKITTELIGRLDVVLAKLLDQPRSQAQKLIKAGLILINGHAVVKANYQLKDGEVLEAKKPATKKIRQEQKPLPAIKVIKETADYLVIDKPAGLLVHSASDKNEPTLTDWLVKHYPPIKKVGDDLSRPGIVHRLDRDVSGLLVVAKTKPAFLALKKQFQDRSIVKEYRALVYDAIKQDEGVINFLLGRSTTKGKMAARPANQAGKEAITEFEVLKHFINYTYLQLIIKTGRTHQIRAHLAAFGHPVVGDNLYGTNLTKIKNKKLNLSRLFLVSCRLEFTDLDNKKQTFKIDLPLELKKILAVVK